VGQAEPPISLLNGAATTPRIVPSVYVEPRRDAPSASAETGRSDSPKSGFRQRYRRQRPIDRPISGIGRTRGLQCVIGASPGLCRKP
jgi:hypothetical protein